MKTKLLSLLGAGLAALSLTSCDVYAPGYAYDAGPRPFYGGAPFTPVYGSYSRPVVYQNHYRTYPYYSGYSNVNTWGSNNWDRYDRSYAYPYGYNRNTWNSTTRTWSQPTSRTWQNSNRTSTRFNTNTRTNASLNAPLLPPAGVSLGTSSALGLSGRTYNRYQYFDD